QGHQLPAEVSLAATGLHNSRVLEMLVVRSDDPAAQLPEFNGGVVGHNFQENGKDWNLQAFIVSRRDRQQRIVWILNGTLTKTSPYQRLQSGSVYRQMLVRELGVLFPVFGNISPGAAWGMYPASLVTLRDDWCSPTRQRGSLSTDTHHGLGLDRFRVCFTDRL